MTLARYPRSVHCEAAALGNRWPKRCRQKHFNRTLFDWTSACREPRHYRSRATRHWPGPGGQDCHPTSAAALIRPRELCLGNYAIRESRTGADARGQRSGLQSQSGLCWHPQCACIDAAGRRARSGGGHNVPPADVERRFERSLRNLPKALEIADRTFVFDNSEKRHRLLLSRELNQSRHVSKKLPYWIVQALPKRLMRAREMER